MAALQHAISWLHIDNEGLETMASVKVSSKYWVVGHQRHGGHEQKLRLGDMHTINAFGYGPKDADDMDLEWKPRSSNTDILDYEGVLLAPGSVL